MEFMENIKYDSKGLVPVIVQDKDTNEVLMLAYMNEESIVKTIETGTTWFFSRSRQQLWNKGETSGNTQRVVDMYYDCDGDSILVKVEQKGYACHTGAYSCFFNNAIKDSKVISDSENIQSEKSIGSKSDNQEIKVVEKTEYDGKNFDNPDNIDNLDRLSNIIDTLYKLVEERKENPQEGSYTNYLFKEGIDKILKKVGEESSEVIIASKNSDEKELIYEVADLVYHVIVLLAEKNIKPMDIRQELFNRYSS